MNKRNLKIFKARKVNLLSLHYQNIENLKEKDNKDISKNL